MAISDRSAAQDQPSSPEGIPDLVESLLRSLLAGPLPKAEAEAALPLIAGARPADVVAAVDALAGEAALGGSSLEPLKPAVARLLNLLRQPLESASRGAGERRDPLSLLLKAENRAALAALEALRAPVALLAAKASPPGSLPVAARELRAGLAALAPLELHYARLENVLFPYFEARYPKYRCLSLMWSIHDDVRRSLRALSALLSGDKTASGASPYEPAASPLDGAAVALQSGRLFFDVNALVFREESLLFPVAIPLLSPRERLSLFGEALALGPGLLGREALAELAQMAEGYAAALEDHETAAAGSGGVSATVGAATAAGAAAGAATAQPGAATTPRGEEALPLDAGSLSLTVLDALLKRLPLDLTFIDAQGRVAYFSNGDERIFPRSRAVIGRDVRNCHPPESLGRVLGLIEDFRSGRREREAFHIQLRGRFVHIEYFALRGADGEFLGVLEASEDLTEKRALSGEKRLASESP